MFKNFRNNNSEEGKQMFVANHKAYHSEDVYVHGQKYTLNPKTILP
jgi:hypothetical protein